MTLAYPPSSVAMLEGETGIRTTTLPDGTHVPWNKARDLASSLASKVYIQGLIDNSHTQTPNARKCVFWNGHEFEGVWCGIQATRDGVDIEVAGPSNKLEPHERSMELYFPIDPRVKEIDVVGAVEAYPNEDNTAWLFRHTQEGTHHDYELTLISAVDGVTQPLMRQYHVDMLAGGSESARSQAQRRFVLMSGFYGEVVGEARKIARAVYLGEREQKAHPREGWLDRDITAAVAKVKASWTETKANDLAHIASGVTYIENSLAMPTVETRIQQAERLAKEAKAAEEAAAAAETSQSEDA